MTGAEGGNRRSRSPVPPKTGAAIARELFRVAGECGWRAVHFRAAGVRSGRWVTPYTGDGGFPDVVLARDGSVLVLELKGASDRVRPGQLEWLVAAGAPRAGIVTGGFVGPRELAEVLDHLRGHTTREELSEALLGRLLRALERSENG